MRDDELPFLPVSELGPLIQQKKVSPVELVKAYLDRIERLDSRLCAYITICSDQALETAQSTEAEIAQGQYRGPLHGIPVGIKDQLFTKGIRTTSGSRVYSDFVPDEDATVVARLKEAGATILGKLNLSELAMGGTRNHPYGTPRNPWDLERIPGMSSSGSGVAVAASMAAATLGADTGGSIRTPATACGIVGLRPTVGRVSRYGSLPVSWSMDTIGPMTRTVRDCALMLQAIAGHDPKDPLSSKLPVPDHTQGLDLGLKGMRVGYVKEPFQNPSNHPEIREAIHRALAVFEELGAQVEEVSIPLVTVASIISITIIDADRSNVDEGLIKHHIRELDPASRGRILTGHLLPTKLYQRALKARQLLRAQMVEAMKRVDVLLLPGSVNPPPKIADDARPYQSKEDVVRRMFGLRSYTAPHSLAAMPAISIPCGFTSDNLPIGLHIGGRYFDEATVFRAAHAYEAATDWHQRRPNL